ncbi:hypothetical protein Droror1_Dr00021676 [Drosera rotundifolia]
MFDRRCTRVKFYIDIRAKSKHCKISETEGVVTLTIKSSLTVDKVSISLDLALKSQHRCLIGSHPKVSTPPLNPHCRLPIKLLSPWRGTKTSWLALYENGEIHILNFFNS